jgi:hypothetical protein
MGQDSGEKWTAAAVSQPTIPKSDRLLGATSAGAESLLMLDNPAQPKGEADATALSCGIFIANDMVPVSHFSDDPWPSDYHARNGTNLAVANLRMSIDGRRGEWSAGYFYRQDWLLKANRDTVDAHYFDQTDQLASQTRKYDLDYSLRGFSADGLRAGWSRAFRSATGDELRWGLAASLLHGHDVRVEQARGNLVTTLGSATLVGNRELFNTRLRAVPASDSFNAFTPVQPQDVPAGWGYAFDFGLAWHLANGANLAFAVNDLLGRIQWDSVPVIEQNVNGALAGGALVPQSSASISGSNRYQSLTLNLKPKLRFEGDYPLGDTSLMASAESLDGQWFPQLGASYAVAANWRLGLQYETRFGSAEISLRHPNFDLTLSSQKLSLSESRALGIAAGVNYSF